MLVAPFVRPPVPVRIPLAGRAWRPALGAPPRKELGNILGLSLNLDNTTILIGLGGLGALFFSDSFDSDGAKMATKIGGYVALGYAGYRFLFEGPKDPVAPPQSGQTAPQTSPTKGNWSDLSASVIQPVDNQPAPSTSWLKYTYKVAFQFENMGQSDVQTPIEFRVNYYNANGSFTRKSYLWNLSIPAGGAQTITDEIEVDTPGIFPFGSNQPTVKQADGTLFILGHQVAPTVHFTFGGP